MQACGVPLPPSTAARELRSSTVARAVYECVLYADLFDCAITVAEICRHAAVPLLDQTAVTRALRDETLAERLSRQGDLACLRGREELFSIRRRRAENSRRMWRQSRRWARFFAAAPFVRMIAVTGSLAVDNVEGDCDIDLFVVTEPGRLWLCRAFFFSVALACHAMRIHPRLCPNYLVTTRALELEAADRDYYVARELAQMVPLWGQVTYELLRARNTWMVEYQPNAGSRWGAVEPVRLGRFSASLRRGTEWALAGRLGDRLERWETARAVPRQRRRAAREGGDLMFGVDVYRGQFSGHGARIRERYAQRLAATPPGQDPELAATDAETRPGAGG
jgi:hypothetical protein